MEPRGMAEDWLARDFGGLALVSFQRAHQHGGMACALGVWAEGGRW